MTGDLPAVLVTGAASGIGRATALALLRQGRAVIAWDLPATDLAGLRAESGATRLLHCDHVDVADPAAVAEALARVSQDGAPGSLVSCAAPASSVRHDFADGVLAVLRCTQVPTDAWLALAHLPPEPSVAHVVSIAGTIVGGEGPAWYAAGKAAVLGYSRWLARHRPAGVRANAVAPGLVHTPRMSAWSDAPGVRAALGRNPLRRPAEASEVAEVLTFLISPAASYLNGVLLPVDGGLTVA